MAALTAGGTERFACLLGVSSSSSWPLTVSGGSGGGAFNVSSSCVAMAVGCNAAAPELTAVAPFLGLLRGGFFRVPSRLRAAFRPLFELPGMPRSEVSRDANHSMRHVTKLRFARSRHV